MSGIQAEHFTIHEWLGLVSDAVAQLPEFQRDVVWKPDRVVKFLDAILENRPVGCLLVLKVRPAGAAPFDPRSYRWGGTVVRQTNRIPDSRWSVTDYSLMEGTNGVRRR